MVHRNLHAYKCGLKGRFRMYQPLRRSVSLAKTRRIKKGESRVSDRGGREDDPRWHEPPRRTGGSRHDREAPLTDDPAAGGRRYEEDPLAGRSSRRPGRGVRRSRGGRRSGGTGLYGSEIGSNIARAAVAEIVGTFILVYAGTTVAVLATLGAR